KSSIHNFSKELGELIYLDLSLGIGYPSRKREGFDPRQRASARAAIHGESRLIGCIKKGITDRQLLAILGRVDDYSTCGHQAKRAQIVWLGPSSDDGPMRAHQWKRQIDGRCAQQHPGELARADKRC